MKACFSADKAREINAPLQGGKRAHNLSKKKIIQTHNQLYTANQPAGSNSVSHQCTAQCFTPGPIGRKDSTTR